MNNENRTMGLYLADECPIVRLLFGSVGNVNHSGEGYRQDNRSISVRLAG
jgi:hypothetical protein